jgi:hypothetical protein
VQNGSINICLIHLCYGWVDHCFHFVELITFYYWLLLCTVWFYSIPNIQKPVILTLDEK